MLNEGAARKRAARVAAKSPRDQRWSAFVEFVLQGVLYTNATSQRVASVLATCYLGGPSETTSFPSKPTGAHTCAPLLVSFKEDEAVIIAQRPSSLDSWVFDLERSSGYVNTIFGWSSRAPPQVAYSCIMAISSLWHRMSPFQRLKMIPSGVSIS